MKALQINDILLTEDTKRSLQDDDQLTSYIMDTYPVYVLLFQVNIFFCDLIFLNEYSIGSFKVVLSCEN